MFKHQNKKSDLIYLNHGLIVGAVCASISETANNFMLTETRNFKTL